MNAVSFNMASQTHSIHSARYFCLRVLDYIGKLSIPNIQFWVTCHITQNFDETPQFSNTSLVTVLEKKAKFNFKNKPVEGCSLATFFFYFLIIWNICCRSKELLQKGAHNNSGAFKKGESAFLLELTILDHATF